MASCTQLRLHDALCFGRLHHHMDKRPLPAAELGHFCATFVMQERHTGRGLGMNIRPLEDLCGEIRYAVMSHPTVLRSFAMSVLKQEKRVI